MSRRSYFLIIGYVASFIIIFSSTIAFGHINNNSSKVKILKSLKKGRCGLINLLNTVRHIRSQFKKKHFLDGCQPKRMLKECQRFVELLLNEQKALSHINDPEMLPLLTTQLLTCVNQFYEYINEFIIHNLLVYKPFDYKLILKTSIHRYDTKTSIVLSEEFKLFEQKTLQLKKTVKNTKSSWYYNAAHQIKSCFLALIGKSNSNACIKNLVNKKQFNYKSHVQFSDVIGMNEAKDAFEPLIEFLTNQNEYISKNNIPYRSYLLYGASNCSKTFLIEALCGEIAYRNAKKQNQNIYFIDISDEKININQIFSTIKSLNGSIILYLGKLKSEHKNLSAFKHISALLKKNNLQNKVIFIAATNQPEFLNFALQQPDGLETVVNCKRPTPEERLQFINKELIKLGINQNAIDIEQLVKKTDGQSFDGLKNVIKFAHINSWLTRTPINECVLKEPSYTITILS